MSDTQEPSKTQKENWTAEALEIIGFEGMPAPGIYAKKHDDHKKILVDLNEKQPVATFMVDGKRITVDDEHGTLLIINQIIVDAETGKMPTKSEPDEVVDVHRSDAAPGQMDESTESVDSTTDKGNIPAVAEPAHACAPTENKGNILALIQKYVGNDVMQIFGNTGAGKSKFGLEAARQATTAGKKVYYLDTERNLTDEDVASLTGCTYKYTPVLDEIDKLVQNLPAVDVVILDSIGFPVLTTYARLSMKQKGDALLQLIAIFGDLKTWAYKNNGVAIVTNQPESEFNKEKGHIFRPFGDKSQFACKEIWKTKIKSRGSTETNIQIEAFRSRSVGFGTKIATMKITDAGVDVSA